MSSAPGQQRGPGAPGMGAPPGQQPGPGPAGMGAPPGQQRGPGAPGVGAPLTQQSAAPGFGSPPMAGGGRDIVSTLSSLPGSDTFNSFTNALSSAGVDLAGGTYTVFAPPDSVVDEFLASGGQFTPEVVRYHIVNGQVLTSAFSSADLTTLQGGRLTYRRMFRKDFIDDATPGTKASDVMFSNGVVHSCDMVLRPGWMPPIDD